MTPPIQAPRRSEATPCAASASTSFEQAAGGALTALRDAVKAAIASVGGTGLNSLALSRKLEIDKSLSWRIVRFAEDADSFAGSHHLPGDAGMRIFVRAVTARSGIAAGTALAAAIDALDRVVREHAGSRTAFRALVANCGNQAADHRAAEFRKTAFQANSAIWGIAAHARVVLAFLTPGVDDGTDVTLVGGFLGLRRNRRELSWPIARRRVLGQQGRTRESIAVPLDPALPIDAPPILADYSSIAADRLLPISTEHGYWYELPEGDIGSAGAVDCIFGERIRGAGPVRRPGTVQPAEVLVRLDMPVEHLLVDVFVDRSLQLDAPPSAALYGLLGGGSGENAVDRDRQRMALAERPEEIGNEPRHWSTPVFPRHWELVHDCMRWLDRRPSSFRAFRLHVRWPAIPTALTVTAPLGRD
jgi:hypothetical protein